MTDTPFIKGLELSELLYLESVRPILQANFPGLVHSAALLGQGSEVLGFDTPQSRDHDWGPRLMLFLSSADHTTYAERIDHTLRRELPHAIHGYPTDMAVGTGDNAAETPADAGVDHAVMISTVHGFFQRVLGFDPSGDIGLVDWLSVPEQRLRSLTAGRVFHDGLGRLEAIRSKLRYYPHDLWLYLLACQWRRIGQEEAFAGRCAQVGDELGSRLVAARLVRDLMRLCFLMERQYAPYIKWLGTAFVQLRCASVLAPTLAKVIDAGSWTEREQHLTLAYQFVAQMHNDLGVTEPLPAHVSPFHERPFSVIGADRFSEALCAAISDEDVLALPAHLGSIDQWVDSTDAMNHLPRLRVMYEQGSGGRTTVDQ